MKNSTFRCLLKFNLCIHSCQPSIFNIIFLLIKISKYTLEFFFTIWSFIRNIFLHEYLLTFSGIDFTGKTCWTSSGLLMVHFSSPVQSIIHASYGMLTKVNKTMQKKHNHIMNIWENFTSDSTLIVSWLSHRFSPSDFGFPFPLCSRCGMGPISQVCCLPQFR